MDTDKELQTKLDDKEDDIVTSFATYLMQKQQDEIDKLRAEIKRLEKENAHLLKACEEPFTFNTTTNEKFSIFNLVRKEFAEKLKERILHYLGVENIQQANELSMLGSLLPYDIIIDSIDESLKEHEE